jgi:serine/threonine protein kinase
MPLVVGARLGPYEISGLLGAGGMGEVYKARDTRLDRIVAIKVLPADISADRDRRTRFEREAKTIAGLTHPHICTLHDVGEHAGSMFLVMEHLQGQTLARRLENGPLPVDQALTIAIEIGDALSAAHRHGVVHRDLKPGNVMLAKAGAKLLDFGLAKLAAHGEQAAAALLRSVPTRTALTTQGVIVGTLPYMAPEQLEGKEADARSDIFAFGAVLYEMLTAGRSKGTARRASSRRCSSTIPHRSPPCSRPHRLRSIASSASACRRSQNCGGRRQPISSMNCGGSLPRSMVGTWERTYASPTTCGADGLSPPS